MSEQPPPLEWWPPPELPPRKKGLATGAIVMLVVTGLVAAIFLGLPWATSAALRQEESAGFGVWRVCDHVSREVADDFVESYPYTDSHEPNAP